VTGSLVFTSLRRHPLRTGLVVLGIAVAAALLLDMVMLAGGIDRSFAKMLSSRGFQIRLSPKGTLPFDTDAVIPEITKVLSDLDRDPDVIAAGPTLLASIHLRTGDSTFSLIGAGVDPAAQGLYQLDGGADLAPNDSTGIVLSGPAAAATGLEPGDSVTLLGRLDSQLGRAGVERRMVVRGVARFLYDARDQRSIAVHLRLLQQLARLDRPDPASLVMVKVRSDDVADSVAARLGVANPHLEVNSIATLVARFRTRLAYFQQLSLILATISLVVGCLLVGTILTITTSERSGELAVLRAIGFRRRRIVELVIAEGAVLTTAGTAVGVGLGLATAKYLDAILTSFPGLPAAISFFVAEPGAVARGALVMAVAGIAAAGFPAWRAGRAPIAATLRADAE
jgi:putative ABC transport system permease protein